MLRALGRHVHAVGLVLSTRVKTGQDDRLGVSLHRINMYTLSRNLHNSDVKKSTECRFNNEFS